MGGWNNHIFQSLHEIGTILEVVVGMANQRGENVPKLLCQSAKDGVAS